MDLKCKNNLSKLFFNMTDLNIFLSDAIDMARSAGEIQLDFFRSSHLNLETKLNDYDVVTSADKESERLVMSVIKEKYPDHGIISEESAPEEEVSEWRWVIDPLDGTTNFSQGLPVFSISIALEHFGEAVVGVVFAPYLGELFHAVKGSGAFLNGKRIYCSKKEKFSESVLATGIPYDKKTNPDNNIREVALIAPMVRGVRRLGSAAMDLSYVAAGFFDGYWELNLNRWDVAAGRLIAEEAGAVIKSIRNDRKYSLMAASPKIADELFGLLTK